MTDCSPHRPCRRRRPPPRSHELPGDVAIGNDLPIRNFQEDIPNRLTKRTAEGSQRKINGGIFSGEIPFQPFLRLAEYRKTMLHVAGLQGNAEMLLPFHPQSGKVVAVTGKGQQPDGRLDGMRVIHKQISFYSVIVLIIAPIGFYARHFRT